MKYARIGAFYRLLGPFSKNARKARMARLVEIFQFKPGARVLDLGGQPDIWRFVSSPLDITILNLPGIAASAPDDTVHSFTLVEGDACNVEAYGDKSFDFVFSNSVIEHVGDAQKQASFAREVRRLADRYWVQTPSIWFPLEAHTGVPFWFFLPERVRAAVIRRWEKKLPAWTDMVKGTRVLSRRNMTAFFSDATVVTEWKFLFPKSYIAYKR